MSEQEPYLEVDFEAAEKADPAPGMALPLKRMIGQEIWRRHEVEGQSLRECWRAVRPESRASDPEKQAGKWLAWYRIRFPYAIRDALKKRRRSSTR